MWRKRARGHAVILFLVSRGKGEGGKEKSAVREARGADSVVVVERRYYRRGRDPNRAPRDEKGRTHGPESDARLRP